MAEPSGTQDAGLTARTARKESQQAELGRRLAGKMGWPTQKTAAGTSLAGHDFRQRKSGMARSASCPNARSFPISIRRGQKSSDM